MKALLILFIALALSRPAVSQEWKSSTAADLKTALGKCSALYRSENYALEYTMTLYENAGSPESVTTKGSLIRGKGRQYRSEQPGKLVIQTEQVKLLVDSVQQVAGIIRPDTLFDAIELTGLLANTAWEELTIESLHDSRQQCFRASGLSLGTYASIEFRIDAKTGYLTGMTLDFRPYNYFSDSPSDETVEQPRAVIAYSLPKKITAAQQQQLDVSSWIVKKGERYELAAGHPGFRLEDYRIPVHH